VLVFLPFTGVSSFTPPIHEGNERLTVSMNNGNSLSDSRWECKDHVVWIPEQSVAEKCYLDR